MNIFEKLGVFYLGKKVDPKTGTLTDEHALYDSKDLTTHAVCVGMTGSGKTGLGVSIIEEAALDKIPSIIIDPKGDLTNLLLTFPNACADEFRPWVDASEAERKGMSVDQYAEHLATTWQNGLAAWGQSPERIRALKNAVEMVIYTPASAMGVPLSILQSFAAPTAEERKDFSRIRDKIMSITSSLLGLLGIQADPIKSREHILIATLIDNSWQDGKDIDIAALIQHIQKPPFTKIGALDVDTFYPPKERVELSITLNNLLASPGFHAWMEGEPLDIKRLLYTPEGKPKISILSIAHLSDAERMFFVTLLLNEYISWMRQQPGTTSLRALLYMDEIFGYFPPTAMPPSKLPMLTLLKQARAFGVGIVLVTQNPVDLDYKGLSNCGTWFIGKLQTERDKMRVVEGLQIASNGELDADALDAMLAMTGMRTFIMRSVHKKEPVLFQTRWTLSYLKGPLTLNQIALLTVQPPAHLTSKTIRPHVGTKPTIPPGITEYYVHTKETNQPVHYTLKIMGIVKLHYVDAKNKVDVWEVVSFAEQPSSDGKVVNWSEATNIPQLKSRLLSAPIPHSTFDECPPALMQEKTYTVLEKSLAAFLYQNHPLKMYKAPEFALASKIGESEGDFRARLALYVRERRDEMVKKLQEKYADKINSLSEKIKKAQNKVEDKQQKSLISKVQTWISFGATIIGALMGSKGITKGTISETGTSLKRASRLSKDAQDVARAQETYEELQQQLEDLQQQIEHETMTITVDPQSIPLETITISPRKSDIAVETISLVWWA